MKSREQWTVAKFIAAENEEELNMVAERNPEVKKAVVTLQKLSADEQARDMYERREKALRDIDSRERWARTEGRAEGKAEGKAEGMAKVFELIEKGVHPAEAKKILGLEK